MSLTAAYQKLLTEFGRSLGIPGLAFNESGYCRLTFDEAIDVHFQINEPSGEVYLYTSLGPLPESGRAAACEILLRGNLFWDATNGATLSIEGDDQPRVMLARNLPWRTLDVTALSERVEQFVNVAQMWTALLSTANESSPDDQPDEIDDPTGPLMRV